MYNGPNRKRQRMENFDYSENGYYFVTICTQNKQDFFGEIIEGRMVLNDLGEIAKQEILNTPDIRKEIQIDEFIIMPNHMHLIIVIENQDKNDCKNVGNTGLCSLPKHKNALSNTVQRIKSSITNNIRKNLQNFEFSWQKSFYDRF